MDSSTRGTRVASVTLKRQLQTGTTRRTDTGGNNLSLQLQKTKRNNGLSLALSLSTPNFFHGSESFWQTPPHDILPGFRIKSRLGWSGEESLSVNTPQTGEMWAWAPMSGKISSIYISYEFPLGRHFLLCKSLSTTMTAVIVSLRRAAGDAAGVSSCWSKHWCATALSLLYYHWTQHPRDLNWDLKKIC